MGFLLDRPSFKETFANQRDVVKNERRQRVENVPLGAVSRLELEALFPLGHPYRHEVIGSMEDLDAASEADVKDFYDRYYAPSNAVLMIAGDIDTAITKGLIEKYFGPIKAGPTIERVPVPTIPPPRAERRLAMEANINLPRGEMVWNTVPVFAPGDADLDLVANVLGEGRSSRLYQRLVHDLKIAQSVSANHMSRLYGGSFEIDYTAMQGHTLAEIERVVDEELDKLHTQPPTPRRSIGPKIISRPTCSKAWNHWLGWLRAFSTTTSSRATPATCARISNATTLRRQRFLAPGRRRS